MIKVLKINKRLNKLYLTLEVKPDKTIGPSNNLNIRIYNVEAVGADKETYTFQDPNWGATVVDKKLKDGGRYTFKLTLQDIPGYVSRVELGLVEEYVAWHYRTWLKLH